MAKRLEAEEKRREAERKWEEAAAKAAVESARNEKLVQRLANLRASLQEAATAARFEREVFLFFFFRICHLILRSLMI